MTTIEHNAKAMSDIFDDVKENTEHELKTMKVETKDLMNAFNTTLVDWTNVTELHRNQLDLQRTVIDLKSRSMRDNLVFCGIPESRGEDYEVDLK